MSQANHGTQQTQEQPKTALWGWDQTGLEQSLKALPIDLQHLYKVSEGDEEFALELLELLVRDNQLCLDEAKIAATNHDFSAVVQTAHKIKGASANLGAKTIQALAETVEQKALNKQSQELIHLILEIETFMQQVQAFLHTKGMLPRN